MREFSILKDVIQIKGINLFTLSDFIRGDINHLVSKVSNQLLDELIIPWRFLECNLFF